jgi:hypothetical protein
MMSRRPPSFHPPILKTTLIVVSTATGSPFSVKGRYRARWMASVAAPCLRGRSADDAQVLDGSVFRDDGLHHNGALNVRSLCDFWIDGLDWSNQLSCRDA